MLTHLVALVTIGVFGLPRQLGDPHVPPPPTTSRFSRQIAVAPLQSVGAHRIVLARRGAPIEVEVDANTPVFVHGQPGRLEQLHAGERVRVSYDAVNGPPRANWVELLSSEENQK